MYDTDSQKQNTIYNSLSHDTKNHTSNTMKKMTEEKTEAINI